MPSNQLYRYPNMYSYAPYGMALGQGLYNAYRYRNQARAVGTAARGFLKPKKYSKPFKKKGTVTKRPVGRSYTGGNDFTSTKRTIKSKRPKTVKSKVNKNNLLIKSMMHNEIYRFQNITNFDTDLGALSLRNYEDPVSGTIETPIHVYDISAFSNENNQIAGYQFGWASASSGASMTRNALPGQFANGGINNTGVYHSEKTGTYVYPSVQNALHNWTDIRFNFYGPRKRTTYFEVMFVVIKSQFADLLYGATSNPSSKLLLQYLERPLIYSNLQTDVGGEAYKMFKVVRRFRYYVSASQSTDVDTSVGKIKEAKIFFKHDRMRHYDWQHNNLLDDDILPHGPDDGINYVRDDDVHNQPAYDRRLFMIVRAFAPERSTDESPVADRDPTYDIIIRNSFSYMKAPNSGV